jgi:uroporphyrinogen decarboxylase
MLEDAVGARLTDNDLTRPQAVTVFQRWLYRFALQRGNLDALLSDWIVRPFTATFQIFDSWGGMLSPVDYQEFSWFYMNQIVEALAPETKVIVFGKGCWFALGEMGKSRASALGVDWTCSPRNARYLSGGNITLQGNFDPSRLLSPPSEIKKMVHQMIQEFGKDKYIVNLGHGILPNIPLDHAKAFIDAVKEYKSPS